MLGRDEVTGSLKGRERGMQSSQWSPQRYDIDKRSVGRNPRARRIESIIFPRT
jgi:hypothetical protein